MRRFRWNRKAVESSEKSVEVTIFAIAPATRDYRNPCTDGWISSRTLFPPLVEILDRSRQELALLCGRLSRLEPIHRRVEEYRDLLEDIEELQHLIARIESNPFR